MTKNLNDIEVGDKITAMGDKVFDETLVVTNVQKYRGSVICVKLAGGRFWPMDPRVAVRTEVTITA